VHLLHFFSGVKLFFADKFTDQHLYFFSGKIPSRFAVRLTRKYWVPTLRHFVTIPLHPCLPLFVTIRHSLRLFVIIRHYSLFATVRCSLFETIRYSGFPDSRKDGVPIRYQDPVFCGCGSKCFSSLKGTNPKTRQYPLGYFRS